MNEMTGTKMTSGRILTSPSAMTLTRGSKRGIGFGTPVKMTRQRFSMKNETPIAEISAEMRGAERSGR